MYPLTFIGSTPKVYVFTEGTAGSNGLTGEEREGERERGRGGERGREREREREIERLIKITCKALMRLK